MGPPKLNKRKINYIIRAKTKGQSCNQIAKYLKISVSTVKKVWINIQMRNWKMDKFDNHRNEFKTFEGCVEWYNAR